jgi:hypothetical protein
VGFGLGSEQLEDFFQDWVYCGVSVGAGTICLLRGVAVRRERLAWTLMGIGLFAWAAGDIAWTLLMADDPSPPYPSVSDFLYLAFYPASYASLLLVARSRTDSFRSSLWLDGAIAGLTVAGRRRPCGRWRGWCARATSASTAAAIRTGCAETRSRSGPALSPCAMPSTP